MRRIFALLFLVVSALALWNCRAGHPLAALPQVGAAPIGLEARFSRPPNWQWRYLLSTDGAKLRAGGAEPRSPAKATVVFVGGYTEFAEKYFELFNDLLSRGYAVATLDWRGQGGSQRYLPNPQMAHSLGFAHDEEDLRRFLRSFAGRPVYLVAHSMGGNIALRLLHDHPGMVKAAVLSAPALRIGSRAGMPAWQARTLSGLMVAAGLGQSYALHQHDWVDDPSRHAATSPVSHDEARDQNALRWFRERPELRVGGGTYRWAYEFYSSCATVMDSDYLAAIHTPILLGSAGQDILVDSAAQSEACARLPACRLVTYPAARHELFNEVDAIRTPWLRELDQFITSH